MRRNIKLLVFSVKDIEKSKEFYRTFLGVEPYADSPYYVGFRIGDQEIGLDPNSSVGPIGYIDTKDIKKSLEELVSAGGEVVQDIKDVGAGMLIAQIKDNDDNVVGLRQYP